MSAVSAGPRFQSTVGRLTALLQLYCKLHTMLATFVLTLSLEGLLECREETTLLLPSYVLLAYWEKRERGLCSLGP